MTNFHDLDYALVKLKPSNKGHYIYHHLTQPLPVEIQPFATISEDDSTIAIIPLDDAEKFGLLKPEQHIFNLITLYTEFSPEATGLTAAVAAQLTAQEIPCNFVTGVKYAHFLVPNDQVNDAMEIVEQLTKQAQGWMS